jgi:hypothetical protein
MLAEARGDRVHRRCASWPPQTGKRTTIMQQLYFIQLGTGVDLRGQSLTKAAVRAVRNAIGTNLIPSVPLMKDFERDYPDHTTAPYFEHGDEPQCNTSDNPTFYEVMDAHVKRRSFLMGGLAAISTGSVRRRPVGAGARWRSRPRPAGFSASLRFLSAWTTPSSCPRATRSRCSAPGASRSRRHARLQPRQQRRRAGHADRPAP